MNPINRNSNSTGITIIMFLQERVVESYSSKTVHESGTTTQTERVVSKQEETVKKLLPPVNQMSIVDIQKRFKRSVRPASAQ